MKRRIFAGLLALLTLFTLVSCSKTKSPDNDKEPVEDDQVSAPGSETKYNFLVLGHDRAANLADVILLVSFDIEDHSLTLMQIPRDTFMDYGGNHYKINSM